MAILVMMVVAENRFKIGGANLQGASLLPPKQIVTSAGPLQMAGGAPELPH